MKERKRRPVIWGVIVDWYVGFRSFIHRNLMAFSNILIVSLPFIMLALGYYCYMYRGQIGIGGEIAVPPIVLTIAYLMRGVANKTGVGNDVPVPEVRFTMVEDGEVTMELDRQPELLLYVADLEDWFERTGRM